MKKFMLLNASTINSTSLCIPRWVSLELGTSRFCCLVTNYSLFQRANVICGLHEPTDEEIAGMSDDEKEDELCAEIKAKVKIEDLLPPKDQKAKEEAE